jgi:hypothetical protein
MVQREELVHQVEINAEQQQIFEYLQVPLQLEKLNENM